MVNQVVKSIAQAAVLVCVHISLTYGACPNIVSRAEWNARAPLGVSYLTNQPVQYAFIHHTAGNECFDLDGCAARVRAIQAFHIDDRGWNDIGYSFVVGGDGSVFEGRGWDKVGAHTKGYNDVGLGFVLAGNFMDHLPTQAQLDAVQNLLECGVSLGKLSPSYTLRGHRDMASTACPGDQLYPVVQSWPHYT